MLSRLAREFAAEIADHDWSDAPYRLDRAGHQRSFDSRPSPSRLEDVETDRLRTNVAWVVGQVLAYSDPNFDIDESALSLGAATLAAGAVRLLREIAEAPDTVEEVQ